MKGYIPDDKIDQIMGRTDIVDVVSPYVNLRKAGRNYLGLCPFHSEKTPSFTVSPDKQMYYCFGCGERGTAVSFLMKMDNLSFPEALRHLAAKAGVELPDKPRTAEDRGKASIWAQIVGVNRLAERRFTANLISPRGEVARDYLKRRGIGDETIRRFRLGYALDEWDDLKNSLMRERVPLKQAEQAGLLVSREDGHSYDRFRGRIVFPVSDVKDRPIAFGGRLLGPGEPKYLNSPESPVYTKGRHLYGLNVTREDIRKNGYAVVVEGYFDLVSLWNAGVTHVVATLGTALTRDQVDLLRRYTSRVAVVFDPDEAGRRALERSLSLFLAGNIHVKAVVLPEGLDPDDFVRSQGPERFLKEVENARPAVEYYIDEILGGNRGTLQKDREALKEAVRFVSQIENAAERNLFARRIAERLGIEEGLLLAEIASHESSPKNPLPKQVRNHPHLEDDPVALRFIRILLACPEKTSNVRERRLLDWFTDETLRGLAECIVADTESGRPMSQAAFIDRLEDEGLKERLIRDMALNDLPPAEALDREYVDIVVQMRKRWFRQQRQVLNRQLRQAQEGGDEDRCNVLLGEMARLLLEERRP